MSATSTSRRRNASRGRMRFRVGDRVIQIRPDDGVETFRTVNDAPGAYQNEPPAETLPGFGDRRDDCGDEIPHFCTSCGKPVGEIERTCYQWTCPRCAPAAVMRRSITAAAKIEETRATISRDRGGHSPKFHHVVIRPPNDAEWAVAKTDAKDAFFRFAKAVLDDLGAYGGLLAYHPWTGEDGDDRGAWKGRLFNERGWDGDVLDELDHQPHIHAIVVADSIDHHACAALHDQTDVIIRRIEKQDSNVSLYGLEDLARATTYSLSHVGVDDGDASYRYFGDVSQTAADDTTEARVRRVVRSVVPDTLGLNVSDLTCDRTLDDDEDAETAAYAASGADSDSEDDDDQNAADGATGRVCGGRLLPITKAPHFLENESLAFEAELREAWQNWPPPD